MYHVNIVKGFAAEATHVGSRMSNARVKRLTRLMKYVRRSKFGN